jgi:hypothetical protein
MEFTYTFFIKLAQLVCGTFSIYLGYRLFMKGIFPQAGDVEGSWKGIKISIKAALPGVYFTVFGSLIVISSIYKVAYFEEKKSTNPDTNSSAPPPVFQRNNLELKDSVPQKPHK